MAPRILLVDDESSIRTICRVNLESDGLAVTEAVDGRAALEAVRQQQPELVLLDVMMPDVDGWELLRRIHEKHGAGSIPVLMFSGAVNAADEAHTRGAQGFVRKPFDPNELVAQAKQMVPV